MSEFQAEYEDSTNAIDSIITQPVLDWANIPGSLTKVSSSASGFAWGFSSPSLYQCALPCTGNWKPVEFNVSEILDVETDNLNVYVLAVLTGGATYLFTSSASVPQFVQIQVPFAANKIFSTHTYIWAQDSTNNKQKCPKPCMTNNWIKSDDTSVSISSASDSTLYGRNATGEAVKTDENMQSDWSPIVGLEGVQVRSLMGKGDASAIYGIDQNSSVFKFDGSKIEPIATKGYQPTNLSIEPISKQLWMTTATPGDKGNLFNRLDNPDYTTLLNQIAPLDKARDQIVQQVGTAYSTQTNTMAANKQISEVVNYFKSLFNLDRTTGKKGLEQAGKIKESIRDTQTKIDQMTDVQPLIIKLIILLIVVSVVFIILHPLLSLVTMVSGLIYILFFSNNGESTIFSSSSANAGSS